MKRSGRVRFSLVVMGLGWVALPLLGGCRDSGSDDDDDIVTGTSGLVADTGPQTSGSAQRARDLELGPFELVSVSVAPGERVELNREIEFEFNQAVDFTSVSLNTIQIVRTSGTSQTVSASGEFRFKGVDRDGDGVADALDRRVIVFDPTCPIREDFADAGLQPVPHQILLPGRSGGASNTLRSVVGNALETNFTSFFNPPLSDHPADLFLDEVVGPPIPVVRSEGSRQSAATRVELGGDAADLVYFELDPKTGEIGAQGDVELPLNLYGDADTRVVFEVFFNQMISPAAANLSSSRVRLEFLDSTGDWQPLLTRNELVSNCSTAHVRLEPIGILPAGCAVRAVVLPGFQDIVGQTNLLAIDGFAEAPTATVDFASLTPADALADELFEDFLIGGDDPRSFEDTDALLITQRAEWGDGALTGSLGLDGGGGPGGDFDWIVRAGDVFFFDTTATDIIGGPDGVPTTVQSSVNGIVDVRDLIIEEGGEIRVQGPNPMQVNASRNVIIRGLLDMSGFNAKDVATLNTGNQPEIGGAGVAGGGSGGGSSQNTTGTTLCGGTGFGAFQEPEGGGGGGESQFAPATLGKDARRPGGGGGGRFALNACDQDADPDCGEFGLAAEAGFDGHPDGTGAKSGTMPAEGGEPNESVFVDGDPSNDFFGVGFALDAQGQFAGEIRGELPHLWAGYGGGGAGEAIPGVVNDPWNPGSDEKGGPGGGASGGLRVRALGEIVFGASGVIRAMGGRGGTGENTIFLDHVGGTGGSGSGGHVMLEAATQIDFTDGGANLDAGNRDWIRAVGGRRWQGASTSGGAVSFGGAGGPGVIQLHVPKPTWQPGSDPDTTNIVVPLLQAAARDPLEVIASPPAFALFPTIGAVSTARSKWISVGQADKAPGGGVDLIEFLFDGLDEEGRVVTQDETVAELAPVLSGQVGAAGVSIEADGVTLLVSDGALDALVHDAGVPSNDLYLRTPALLRNFVLRLESAATSRDFDVVHASYDDAAVSLRVTVDGDDGTLADFAAAGGASFELIPRFFRVATGEAVDRLPDTAAIHFRFQAARADASGLPDEGDLLVDWTGQLKDLNLLDPGALEFFRFEVEFDLDVNELGVSPELEPLSLDFLRVPFRF